MYEKPVIAVLWDMNINDLGITNIHLINLQFWWVRLCFVLKIQIKWNLRNNKTIFICKIIYMWGVCMPFSLDTSGLTGCQNITAVQILRWILTSASFAGTAAALYASYRLMLDSPGVFTIYRMGYRSALIRLGNSDRVASKSIVSIVRVSFQMPK